MTTSRLTTSRLWVGIEPAEGIAEQMTPAPFYEIDLRSGMLIMGAGPVTPTVHVASGGSRHAVQRQR